MIVEWKHGHMYTDKPCSSPDCDFGARPDTGRCYAHSQGKNPIMTLEQYERLNMVIPINTLGEMGQTCELVSTKQLKQLLMHGEL